MSKILTDSEREQRKENTNYFKNGKQKKGSMLCRNRQYIKEVTKINGRYDVNWACGGSRCPLYGTGCDNKGRDWD